MITAILSEKSKNLEYLTKKMIDAASFDSEMIFLSQRDLSFFKNPYSFARGDYDDDYKKIEQKIVDAKCIVLVGFSYFGKLDGRISTFMDRTYPLLKDKKLKGKFGVGIIVSENRDDTQIPLSQLDSFFLEHEMKPVSPPAPYSGTGISGFAKLDNEIIEDAHSVDMAVKIGEKLSKILH
jgi:multimeric flavodoxin WrbA